MGKKGEDVACGLLEGMGHRIVARNFRKGHLEIDIVSTGADGVHFVEVKSRMAPLSAEPEENVTPSKQRKIAKAALGYLHGSKELGMAGCSEVHFDVVAVVFDGEEVRTEWFPDAFFPMYV